jgi:glycosyltransferase involved in cell wall biosynthesis
MRIVFLTQYFPPEVGAPQNRISHLASTFRENGADVTVLTAMPNYPEMVVHEEYRGRWSCCEDIDGLEVLRSWIFVKKSRKNITFRLLSYLSFVLTSLLIGIFKLRRFDYIVCESPPLFLGISAHVLNSIRGGKLIFNVSDLMPESAERLGLVKSKLLLSASYRLEEFLYRHSFLVSGQTQGIARNISSRFPKLTVYWLKNGVDLSFFRARSVDSDWRAMNGFSARDFILLYAGILGYPQGLDVILRAAARLKTHPDIKCAVVGSGPVKEELLEMKERSGLDNVHFFDTQPKQEMPEIISACDAGIIPLRKLDLFKGAVPSKAFEYLAMRKPVLLGVEGEAKELLIKEGKCGLAFEPENDDDLYNRVIELYESDDLCEMLGENGLRYVTGHFDRRVIAAQFWQLLKDPSRTS